MKTKEFLSSVMQMAWSFVRKNGYTMSEAMKIAWMNLKLKAALKTKAISRCSHVPGQSPPRSIATI